MIFQGIMLKKRVFSFEKNGMESVIKLIKNTPNIEIYENERVTYLKGEL